MLNDGDQPRGPAGPRGRLTRAYDDALSRLLDGLDVSAEADRVRRGRRERRGRRRRRAKIARALRMIGAEAAGGRRPSRGALPPTWRHTASRSPGWVRRTAGSEVDARVRAVPTSAVTRSAGTGGARSRPARRRPVDHAVVAQAVRAGARGGRLRRGDRRSVSPSARGPGATVTAALSSSRHRPRRSRRMQALLGQGLVERRARERSHRYGGDRRRRGRGRHRRGSGGHGRGSGGHGRSCGSGGDHRQGVEGGGEEGAAVRVRREVRAGDRRRRGDRRRGREASRRGRRWTLRVSEWVSPSSGAGSADVRRRRPRRRGCRTGSLRTLAAGTSGLFLVPADRADVLYAWTGDDVVDGRKKIDAALAKGSSASC